MYDWTCEVVIGLNLDQDTVAVAFSILDRYLAIKVKQDVDFSPCREEYQLFCVACLYLAIKLVATLQSFVLGRNLVETSNGRFTADDITATELDILKNLKWHVNPPTVMGFCNLYMDFYGSLSPRVFAYCRYLADAALADEFFISKPSSVIALGIMLLATQKEGMPFPESHKLLENLQGLVQVNEDEFNSVFRRLECLC